MARKVFVTGGTGFIGGALCRRLIGRGDRVTALVRDPAKAGALEQAGCTLVQGDLRDRSSFQLALEGQDLVFHIAAVFREAKLSDEDYIAINVDGTRNVAEASASAGVGRFLHCSSVAVHGNTGRTPANEDSPYDSPDLYCRSKLDGERAAREVFDKHGMKGVIFRPAGVYGPGDLRFLKLFRGLQKGTFFMIGDGKTLYHLNYIDDLCDGILLCAEKEEAIGDAFILGGERPIELNDMVALVGEAVGRPPRKLRVPVWPVMSAAVVCEKICRPLGIEPPLFPRRVEFFTRDRAFDISRAKRVLGYRPKHSEREGLAKTAAWYREQGLLGSGAA